jgi:hypothetical protein
MSDVPTDGSDNGPNGFRHFKLAVLICVIASIPIAVFWNLLLATIVLLDAIGFIALIWHATLPEDSD